MTFSLTVSFEAWPTAVVLAIVFLLAPLARVLAQRLLNQNNDDGQ